MCEHEHKTDWTLGTQRGSFEGRAGGYKVAHVGSEVRVKKKSPRKKASENSNGWCFNGVT